MATESSCDYTEILASNFDLRQKLYSLRIDEQIAAFYALVARYVTILDPNAVTDPAILLKQYVCYRCYPSEDQLVLIGAMLCQSTLLPLAPTITKQPQSQTVSPGATVNFTVEATGSSPLTYQWRKNGIEIPGATGTTLTITDAQQENDGFYSVSVSNDFGTSFSDQAELIVQQLITIYLGNAGATPLSLYTEAQIKAMPNTFGNPTQRGSLEEGAYEISQTDSGANEYRILAIPKSAVTHMLEFRSGTLPLNMTQVQTNCIIDGQEHHIYRTVSRSAAAFSVQQHTQITIS